MGKKYNNDKLKAFYRVDTRQKGSDEELVMLNPLIYRSPNGNINKGRPVNLPKGSSLDRSFREYAKTCHTNTRKEESFRHRAVDLAYMYDNFGPFARAVETYADYAVSVDENGQCFQVRGETRAVEKFIKNLFNNIGINHETLRLIAVDLGHYGNSYLVNVLMEEIFDRVVGLDIFDVEKIFKYTYMQAQQEKNKAKDFETFSKTCNNIDSLMATLKERPDVGKYYETYNFGYKLKGEVYLPPWSITHFYLAHNDKQFYPYGKPMFSHLISPFKQLKASLNIATMTKVASFPREVFKIKTSGAQNEMEVYESVQKFMMEYENLGLGPQQKLDETSIGNAIYTVDELFEYDVKSFSSNHFTIEDVKWLYQSWVTGTGLPPSLLIPGENSGFGFSGKSMIKESEFFVRNVSHMQSAILKGLIQIVKLAFLVTNRFPLDTKFDISLNSPLSEISAEAIGLKSSSLSLANDIVGIVTRTLGIGADEALPSDILVDILSKYTFMNREELASWVDTYMKSKKPVAEAKVNQQKLHSINYNKVVLEAKYNSGEYFEGVEGQRYYRSSWSHDQDFEGTFQLLAQNSEVVTTDLNEKKIKLHGLGDLLKTGLTGEK